MFVYKIKSSGEEIKRKTVTIDSICGAVTFNLVELPTLEYYYLTATPMQQTRQLMIPTTVSADCNPITYTLTRRDGTSIPADI